MDTTKVLFVCQECPYTTASLRMAERHETANGHDVWETYPSPVKLELK